MKCCICNSNFKIFPYLLHGECKKEDSKIKYELNRKCDIDSITKLAPLLLDCGHAVCVNCVNREGKLVKCSLCDQDTFISEDISQHHYMFGYLLLQAAKKHLNTLQDVTSSSFVDNNINESADLCQECSSADMEYHCKICSTDLCSPCFQRIHAPKTMKHHKGEKLMRFSIGRKDCETHDKECDFICNTCSIAEGTTKVICSVCHFAGEHTLHSFTRLEDWNRDHFNEFTSLREMLKTKVDQLLQNKQVLNESIHKMQIFTEETESFLSEVFLKAHGQLQMNHQLILAQLKDLTYKNVSSLHDLASIVEKNIITANKFLNPANSVQQKNIRSVNISSLMENMSNFLEETFAAFDVPSQFLQEADKPEKWIRFNLSLEENPLSKFVAFDSQNFAHLFKPQSKNQLLSNDSKHSSRSFSSSHSSKETETEKIKQEFGVDRKITNYAELRTYFLDGDANWNFSSDFEQKRLESNIISSMENKNGETLINGDNNNSTLDISEQIKHTKAGSFKLSSLCQEDPLLDLKNEHQNSRSIKERQINAIHQEEGVLVTHIEEKLNTFYIQRLSDKTKIEALSEEIQGFIPSAKFFEENPSPGTLCLGQYSRDGCWYRALILYKKTGKVVAKFIDYGNTDGILFKRLRVCPEELQLKAIPPFAYPCRLWGIEPVSKSFSKEAVVLFHHLVTFQQRMDLFVYSSQQVVNAKEQRRPLIYVDICCISDIPSVSDDLSLSIRECFLFLEFGRSTISEDGSHTVKKIGAEFFERSYHNPHILLNAAPIQVKITRLDSPSSFYVQCCSSKASLKITIGEMKQHYTSETVAKQIGWKILSPKIGMLCAVKCSSDNLWYRACINDVRPGSKVLVTNVDTGEQEVVYYEGLCKIPDKFLQIPAQAIHCKLANIIPVNDDKVWEPSTIEKFRDILEENESIMATFSKKCDDMYEANLLVYHFDRQTSIACELIDSDLALPSQESFASNYLNESPVENFCKIDEFDTFSTRSMKKLNPLKKSSQIIFDSNNAIQSKVTQVESSSTKSLCHALDIIDVISPSLIFARFSDDQKLYEDYQDALYNKMISLTRKKKVVAKFRPQIGKYCVAYFDKSPFFARVLLLEKCDSYYKAFLVDFGGFKNISEEELLPLPKEMKNKKRKLCQVLSMAGICPPCGLKVWPTSTVDFLKRALNSHGQIYMLKRGCCYRDVNSWNLKVVPVDLGWFEEKPSGPFTSSTSIFWNVKTDILENGLALPKSEKLLNLSIASSMDTLATVIDDESNSSTINSSKMNENDNDLNSEVNDSVSEIENELNTELQMSSQDSSSSFCGIPSEEGPFNNTCLPPQPPLEKNFKAVVTYLELNGIVCLHPLESNERLSMMQKAHNLKFKDSQLTDKDLSWDIGYYVVAKFHLDKMWYRAKVLDSKNDNGEVQVEFIDYGNVELVSVEDIRTDFPFMNIPVQCYKCSLGLAPFGGVWTERLLLFFHEICVMKNHEVTVLEESDDSPPLVKLVQEGDTSISNVGDLFVNKLKVCFYTNSSVPDMVHEYESSSDIIIESDDEVFTIEELPYPTDPSELVVVKVVSVVDPSLCFISPQKDVINPTCVGSFWKEAVKAIKAMEELQSFLRVNYNEYKLNEMPLIGGIYLNRFAKEGNSFLRVKVFNVENDEVWVKFIDFGNERKISTKSLYLIPKKYRNVPALAIEVRLKEILEEEERDDFNVQDVENCLMHTDQKMFASFYGTGDPPLVSLFYKDGDGNKVLCYDNLLIENSSYNQMD